MSDISKCEGTDCPFKKECYRFTAPANELWQSYFTTVPYDEDKKECEYLWKRK